MKKSLKKNGEVLLLLVLLCSCASQKKITYLQNTPDGTQFKEHAEYEVRIKVDDMIGIVVNSKDVELIQMFNLPLVAFQMNESLIGQNRASGYYVDKLGMINFPQLGPIKVTGLTRTELSQYIEKMLIERGLVNDPVVTVQFLNFQISVLGEVNRPGLVEMVDDRITLFDAISMCGDLTIFGKRDCVKIIRETDGVRTIAEVDLRDTKLLDSPYYYLEQNDVVYVEPNNVRAAQRNINQNRTISTFSSVISAILSIVTVVTITRK